MKSTYKLKRFIRSLYINASIALIATATAHSYAKTFAGDPRTFSVLIVSPNSAASGCIMQICNSVYLVTAKHVLFNPPQGTNAPTLRSTIINVKVFSNTTETNTAIRTIIIPLGDELSRQEVRYSADRDIAMVRIEQCDTNNLNRAQTLPGIIVLSQDKDMGLNTARGPYTSALDATEVGTDVFMFGYPTSLTSGISDIFDPSEPLLRKGVIAGINIPRKVIIIDCPSYFGNSGGPVIEYDRLNYPTPTPRIIGIVSGFVPFQEEWENKTMGYSHVLKSNSGYTVVEPIDTALEMAWQ